MVQGGEEIAGAVALVVVGGPLGRGGKHRQCRGGSVEGLDLGLLVDGEHDRRDRGFMYKATRSRIFSTSCGSGDTLKLSFSHGLSPKARQISDTV
jgi:hypothetical protein